MIRKLAMALVAVALTASLSGGAHAAITSARNPYRSFNSGVNYGAQQWEHAHGHHHRAAHHLVR